MALSSLPRISRSLFTLLGAAVASAPLAAQGAVHVVDAAGGAGSEFTTVVAAVAAAGEGDVVLIRSGSYSGAPVVDGKSLTLQAEAGASVVLASGMSVRNLGAAQVVAVRGIDMNAPQLGAALTLSACAGPVWIEECVLAGSQVITFPGGGVKVTDCDAVVLTRCVVESFEHQFLDPGLDLVNSRVSLHDATIHGVKGFDQAAGTPNPGSYGVRLTGSTLLASGSTLIGGAGGDFVGFPQSCRDGGQGGVGLALFASSLVTLFDTQVSGGPGGLSNGTCSQGPSGDPLCVEQGSTLVQQARNLGSLSETSPVREGDSFVATVTAEPNALAWIVYAEVPLPAFASPLFEGELLVAIQPLTFVPLGSLPASGTLTQSFPFAALASGLEGLPIFSQLVTLSPLDGRVLCGSATLLTLLDATI